MSAVFGIVGFGACTAVGNSLETSLAAMRAGIDPFVSVPVAGVPERAVTVGSHPHLASGLDRVERLVWLLSGAIDDVRDWAAERAACALPVFAALPADLDDRERRALHAVLQGEPLFEPGPRWAFEFGRAAGFAALDAAARVMRTGGPDVCAVVAVDSLCDPARIEALLNSGRVLGPRCEGTLPGEAAFAALLCGPGHHLLAEPTAVRAENITLNRAKVPFTERAPADGDALAQLFRRLREGGAARADRIVAAHSGEGAMGRCFSTAYLRETELMPEPLEVELIADKLGDVGAAAALAGCAYAACPSVGNNASGGANRQLVYSESDTGELGAVMLAGRPAWRRDVSRTRPRTTRIPA